MTDQQLYGFHAVLTALRSERVSLLWVQSGRDDQRTREALELAHAQKLTVKRVSRGDLDLMVPGARHQGIVAQASQPEVMSGTDLSSILARAGKNALLLVLDGVQDPHNLGACLRSADAAGVHAVITPKDRAAGLTPVVRKVASGAAESVPLITVTNLARTLRELRDAGVWIIGTRGDAEQTLFDIDLRGPSALVLGGEGSGMRRLTNELCDVSVKIPMAGAVESLNVSVAAGVCLFEAVRQRRRA